MGMDVHGKANRDAYFRAGAGSWGGIWTVTHRFAPELCELVELPGTNDGDGLSGEAALALADRIKQQWDDGTIPEYIRSHNERLLALPLVTCGLCGGTGVRTDEVGVNLGMPERGYCNGCHGYCEHCAVTTGAQESQHPGKVQQPEAAWGRVDPDHFKEWVDFLQVSGGFEIW